MPAGDFALSRCYGFPVERDIGAAMNEEVTGAYIQAIRAEHRHLHAELRELNHALQCGEQAGWTPEHQRRAAQLLTAFRDELREHFAREASGGFLEEAVVQGPRFAQDAERMMEQHDELDARLSQIVTAAQATGQDAATWTRLAPQVREFLTALTRHEAEENRILARAFNTLLDL
jgi:iron-sulfur cluster repair protein YtfE (RIC family)